MNTVLQPYINKICVVYLDDIIIYSKNYEQHQKDLETIFKVLYQAQLQIKLKKCKFFLTKVKFLGHEISGEGIKTDPEKIKVMQDLPTPQNLKNVQEVMGLFQYYKSFIKDFAKIAAPLYSLLKKDQDFRWEDDTQKAFEQLKQKMIEAPILAHPNLDESFILYTDASYTGLGFILTQKKADGKEHPIRYEGRKLTPSERNYTITDLECLGIIYAIRKTNQYFRQKTLTLITDHKALETLRKHELPAIGRRIRWILKLEQYNLVVKYRKGRTLAHIDCLSRNMRQENIQEEPLAEKK